jgi:hypothetical protein
MDWLRHKPIMQVDEHPNLVFAPSKFSSGVGFNHMLNRFADKFAQHIVINIVMLPEAGFTG